MEQLDTICRVVDDIVMDRTVHCHRTHGNRSIGEALGHGDDIGRDPPGSARGGSAHTAICSDDLVKDKDDAMPGADIAQPLQVTDRRYQHAG